MSPKKIDAELEATRHQILDAAESRFRQYGFGKTTMAEIASDIDMSTANLYRYYENKMDIGAAMAQRCFSERAAQLDEIMKNKTQGVSQLLENFVLQDLRYTHGQFSQQPKIFELVDIIMNKFPEMILEKIEQDQQRITELLEYGNAAGEFEVEDVNGVAGHVHAALKMFSTPFFMNICPLEQMEDSARGVVKLLIKGLEKR